MNLAPRRATRTFRLSFALIRGASGSPKKLDGDFGWNLLDRLLNFLRGVGQPIRVDVDSDMAACTRHVLVRLQAPDRLPQIVPAIRTLKLDLMQIDDHC